MNDNLIRKSYRKIIPLFIRETIREFYMFRPWRFIFLPFSPLVFLLGSLRRKKVKDGIVKKILVINLGAIGDNLMSTPALRALNKKFPDAKITVIVGSKSALDAYINNPSISTRISVKQFPAGNIKNMFKRKYNIFFAFYKIFVCYPILVFKILITCYDLGVNFCAFSGGAEFGNLLLYFCGIPKRLGAFGGYTDLLTNRADGTILKDRHWVDIYLGIVATIGVPAQGEALEFYVSAEDDKFAENFLQSKGLSAGDFILGIHPGGNTYVNNKRWAYQRFAQVINRLSRKYIFKLLLFGSKDEELLVNNLKCCLEIDAVSVIGFTFSQVAALLKKTQIFLTNDNGVMHLAEAVDVSHIVSIFGPTDPRRSAPQNKKHIYIAPKIDCAPCISLDAGDETKRCFRVIKEECLQSITSEQVYAVLEKMLEKIIHGDPQ